MDFHAETIIEAPQQEVFAALSDFPALEAQALQRGVDLTRQGPPGPQARWRARVKIGGRTYRMTGHITHWRPAEGYAIACLCEGITAHLSAQCIALTPARTQLRVSIPLTARGLKARLLLQGLRFAHLRLNARLQDHVTRIGHEIGTAPQA